VWNGGGWANPGAADARTTRQEGAADEGQLQTEGQLHPRDSAGRSRRSSAGSLVRPGFESLVQTEEGSGLVR
jgi:hypothetical protein